MAKQWITPKPTKELTALSKQINTLVEEYNKTAKQSIVFSLVTPMKS